MIKDIASRIAFTDQTVLVSEEDTSTSVLAVSAKQQ
jgi:hypothetical protein